MLNKHKSKTCLITTSDLRFWDHNADLIALGGWCLNHQNRDLAVNIKKVCPPYGLDLEVRDFDFQYISQLEEVLFPEICKLLNRYHGINKDGRYWRIIIGHWLKFTISMLYNRIKSLEKCINEFHIDYTIELDQTGIDLHRKDCVGAIWSYSDPEWNGYLCLNIIKQIAPNLKLRFKTPENIKSTSTPIRREDIRKKAIKQLFCYWKYFAKLFVKSSDPLIVNSYLGRFDEARLFIKHNSFPAMWMLAGVSYDCKAEINQRASLTRGLHAKSQDAIEMVIRSLIFPLIPSAYLENFRNVLSACQNAGWPQKPKFIFTSNNFMLDEVFKVWTAEKTAAGVKYVVGQHGNNYGTHRFMNPSIEEMTSDCFITWGWQGKLPQHRIGVNIKISKKTKQAYQKNGSLLLIEQWLGHRITTWDNTAQYKIYLDEQFKFVANLDAKIRNSIIVRLHNDSKRAPWGEEEQWKSLYPRINIDDGLCNINKKIRKSRLVVHSYDSTGMLETLALNIPSIAFWQNQFWHLRDEVKGVYQNLLDVGIIHTSPESAAKIINENWGDLTTWWYENIRQKAIQQFCSCYSRLSSDPVVKIANIIGG